MYGISVTDDAPIVNSSVPSSAANDRTAPLSADFVASNGILVLGMHRSGTSAVAGVLRLLGIHIGSADELLSPHELDNPTGYWERTELVIEHDRFLASVGHSWDHVAGYDVRRLNSDLCALFQDRLREIIRKIRPQDGPWLVKDPRLSLLLPQWLPLLDNPACVVVVRDPREIIGSMRNTHRGVLPSPFLLALWEKYVRTLLDNLSGRRAIFVAYEDLMDDPPAQCERVLRELRELGVGSLHAVDLAELAVFLDPKLRRSKPFPHLLLTPLQQSLHAWMREQSRSAGAVAVSGFPQAAATDDLLAEFEAAYERNIEQGRAEAAEALRAVQVELDSTRHARNVAATRVEQAEKRVLAVADELSAAKTDYSHASSLLARAEDRIAAANIRVQALGVDLGESRRSHNATQRELATERHQRNVAFVELATVRHARNIATVQQRLAERRSEELHAAIDALRASWSWRLTAPLRWVGTHCMPQISGSFEQKLHAAWYSAPGLSMARKRAVILWLHRYFPWITGKTISYHLARQTQRLQVPQGDQVTRSKLRMDAGRAAQVIGAMAATPRISIIIPVYNVKPCWLVAAVESVRSQFYPHWELCIVDDGSTDAATKQVLSDLARNSDARIKVQRLPRNIGIAAASNAAIALATGDYIGLLDNDDELTRDALLETASAINASDPDIVYSDEDKIETDGKHVEPHFKPDFSLEYFLSVNYLCHFTVIRGELLRKIGGFRTGFDGAQDFDLLLRATESSKRVVHVPKVLYHWRKSETSTASSSTAKPEASAAGLRALTESLGRRGIAATAEHGPYPTTYRVRRAVSGQPLISIVIPFRDKPSLLAASVNSILDKTDYPRFEILGIDNGSTEPATHALMIELAAQDARVRFIRHDVPFNFSAINNFAARQAQGEHLLFLNNDTEVIVPGWMRAMLEHSQRPEVGVVGAKLLYPDDRIQHSGVIIGIGGVAGHANLLQSGDHPGYFARAQLPQELSAVTFACAMTRRSVFESLGGLNERDLTVAFNDIDYCLRAREAGMLVLYTPYAVLYHHESRTRGYEDNPGKQLRFARETAYMQQRHAGILQRGDPYYNPNLRLDTHDFSPYPGYDDALPR